MRPRAAAALLAGGAFLLVTACTSARRSGQAPPAPVPVPPAAVVPAPPLEAEPSAVVPAEVARREAERLQALAAEYWTHQLDTSPLLRLQHGLAVDRLPDLSYDDSAREVAYARDLLARLETIDVAALDHDGWLTWAVLGFDLERQIEGLPYFWHFFQTTPYSFAFSGLSQILAGSPVATPEDRARYLDLVGQLPRAAGQLRENLATRRQMGILVPRPAIDPIVAVFTAHAGTGEASPFWVADGRLAGLPDEEVESFCAALRRRIDDQVAPAFAALAGDFDAGYRAAAPEAVGQGQYPGGQEAYRYAVRLFTTRDLDPKAIHERGLAAVARIEGEMAEIRRELGYAGAARDFHDALRSDPRFLAATPEEVGERLMEPIRRLEPRVAELFRLQPRAPYGVRRLDPGLEGSMTFGYYQQPTPDEPTGHYLYNGSNLAERPLVNAAALIAHELMPGHHFQIALQMENEELPAFRRESFNSAFVEGWADYASELAGEMGLYQDPWERYGRLAMDMFLSVRLVVDTGMNALGWSREEASEYMAARVLESPTQIATETLRYAVDMPGQALAYKTGAATIWELRRRAEAALGEGFDLAGFHAAVLGPGSLPLAVLEQHIDWWIGEERARLESETTTATELVPDPL